MFIVESNHFIVTHDYKKEGQYLVDSRFMPLGNTMLHGKERDGFLCVNK